MMTSPTRDTTSDVGSTMSEMWSTRPVRDPDDKVIAGVAAALARRYAIDRTLVRVVFVVSAIYGIGLLIYLLGWLVLPERTRPHHTSVLVVVAAVIVGIATVGGVAGGAPEPLIGLLLAAALLYALHTSRAGLGEVPDPAGAPGTAALAVDGPAGADTPVVAAAPRPPRPPRSPLAPITLAAALVAAGAVLAAGLIGWLPLGVTPVAGTALAVIGLGLIVGAFLRAGRWLILAAIPLVLVLLAAAGGPPWADDDRFGPGGPWGPGGWGQDTTWGPWAPGAWGPTPGGSSVRGVENGDWAPATAIAVAPSYSSGLGDARLDLRALPPGPPVTTAVQSGVGDVRVLVGPTADVTVECSTGAGDVRCLGRGAGGPVVDLGVDGPGGPVVSLRAQSGAGNVEVDRG